MSERTVDVIKRPTNYVKNFIVIIFLLEKKLIEIYDRNKGKKKFDKKKNQKKIA